MLPALAAAQSRLVLRIGEQDVDLAARTITYHLTAGGAPVEVDSAELQLHTPDGELLYSGRQAYEHPQKGGPLRIGWPDLGSRGENFRAELKVTGHDGRWLTFEIVRFYTEIPHEEVEFDSASWEISEEEQGKLDAPLSTLKQAVAKYAELMDVKLYVVGHTDTVGKAADNQRLSEKRARAIANYLVRRGGLAGLPVFVRGCGEGALAVKTADNAAERRNRRAQYIISSFQPALAGPGQWRRLQ